MQLDEVGHQLAQVVERRRPVGPARELDGRPGRRARLAGRGRRLVPRRLRRPAAGEQAKQRRQRPAQARPGDDRVNLAMLQHELGGVRAGRQALAGRLLDDARAGEADIQGARLGQEDVALGGEAGVDAAGGRVGLQRRPPDAGAGLGAGAAARRAARPRR